MLPIVLLMVFLVYLLVGLVLFVLYRIEEDMPRTGLLLTILLWPFWTIHWLCRAGLDRLLGTDAK